MIDFLPNSLFVLMMLFSLVAHADSKASCSSVGEYAVCPSLCTMQTQAWQVTVSGDILDWKCATMHPNLGVSILVVIWIDQYFINRTRLSALFL
jgi:hypothetical protein